MIIAHGLGLDVDNYSIMVTGGYGLNPVPIVSTGGSRIQRQRYDFTEWERQREEEELIILMAGWLA